MKNIILIVAMALVGMGSALAQAQSLQADFYKHYTGTIAEQKVSTEIWTINGNLGGRYEYKKHQKPILLSYIEKIDGLWLFGENVNQNDTDAQYPIWKVHFKGHQLVGKWLSSDKKTSYNIDLKEDYPKGIMPFTYDHQRHDYRAFPRTKDSSSYEITQIYPIALGNTSTVHWLNQQIKDLLGIAPQLPFQEGIKTYNQKLLKDYYDIAEEAKQAGKDRYTFQMDWFSLNQLNVIYNKNGYVQIDNFRQGYSGGAHPNHSESNLIYDVKNKELVGLADITSMDSAHLQKLIEAQFRKDHGMLPNDSLNNILFKNYLPPTENLSFNQKGLEFIYNPYEVASYAMGIIYVFIPYEQLKGSFMPEFKKRMNLFPNEPVLYKRHPGETAAAFVNRLKPDFATLLENQVFETNEFDTQRQAILSFYRMPFIQDGKQIDTYIKGFLWLPADEHKYERIVIGDILPNGGAPEIHSVFFANADHHPGRELAVLSKIPQIHYDYGGDFYDVYFFHYDRDKHRFTRVPELSAKFFGCECSFRNGKTKHAKYKTAAEVRAGLKEMGY